MGISIVDLTMLCCPLLLPDDLKYDNRLTFAIIDSTTLEDGAPVELYCIHCGQFHLLTLAEGGLWVMTMKNGLPYYNEEDLPVLIEDEKDTSKSEPEVNPTDEEENENG